MPAFRQVLQGIADAWTNRRDTVLDGARDVLNHVRQAELLGLPPTTEALSRDALQSATQALWRQFDWRHHGWGGAPKFPQAMTIEFLLRQHLLTGEATPLEMATKTLHTMARGGMYDQLGGGFHRYATDAVWLIPHFEKMLYDNAQLARVYLHAWQMTGEPFFRRITEEVLDYVLREMTDPSGGFYASQDADSEGHEGKFFAWAEDEIVEVLGTEDADLLKQAYGVTRDGNFEGQNVLFLSVTAAELAEQQGGSPEAIQTRLDASRRKLFERRESRVHPGRDDKVLAAWNGLMLAAFAEAGRALGRADFAAAATANADFILASMRQTDGRLYRSWRNGDARLNAYLEDYANVAEGLLAQYEASFDERYYTGAVELMDFALAHFADAQGGFFDTSDDHETLVTRPKDIQDNATPSGNGMAVTVLLKLAALTGDTRFGELAERSLGAVQPAVAQYPTAFGQWLSALAFALSQPREVALVGDPVGDPAMQALLDIIHTTHRPFQVVALKRPGAASAVPLLAERVQVQGKATAAVCRNFTCRLPVTDPELFKTQLTEPG
jgi:uncharacterized protein YyaL (SSP411 family)